MNIEMNSRLFPLLGVLLTCFVSAHGQWTEPEPLAEINTAHVDKSPFLSFDGTTLYFSRQAGPGWYYTRIYEATRLDPNGPFSSVTELSSLNYFGGHVDGPWVSPDNLRMYYYRTEPGAQSRLKVSYRNSVIDMWPEGVNVNELNGLGRLASPTLTADEMTIVFSGSNLAGGVGAHDLWMARRPAPHLPFGDAINLLQANSPDSEYHPSLSPDGLVLYYASNRDGSNQLYRSSRVAPDQPFGVPARVSFVDGPNSVPDYPFLSANGEEFYFTRDYGQGRDIFRSSFQGEAAVEPGIPLGDFYVDVQIGNDANTGRSPISPFATIQRGIDAALDEDTVVVADGVYMGPGNTGLDFGGRRITLRSAHGAAMTIIDCQNIAQGVVFQSGEDSNCILDGFTISNGNGQTAGGITCRASSPWIRNCVITNNTGYYSAGVYCSNNSSPIFSGCEISANSGTYGGGVRLVQSDGIFENCLILGNRCSSTGAGLKCDYGSKNPLIRNCTIVGNSATHYGGGLWASYCNLTVRNSIIVDNVSGMLGDEMAVGTFGTLMVGYSNVLGGPFGAYQAGGFLGWEENNIDVDPKFVDPNEGDYHLKSARGRYWGEHDVWVLDEDSSSCLDAGDPADSVLDEPSPHGNLINMGAYGGTARASLSAAAEQPTRGDVNGDGFIDITDLFTIIDNWLSEFGDSLVGFSQ